MPLHRQDWFEGWRLFAVLTLTLVALSVWIAGMRQFEVDGVRTVIRFTARTSLLFFCLAFSAGALARLWPNAWTRWQRRNRRYLGVTFAASHGIHALAIACFAAMSPPQFMEATNAASYIFGGIGYAFIIAMTATSFDRSAAAIGPRAWRILHLVGRLLSVVSVHGQFRQADSRYAALRALPAPAIGGAGAAADRDGVGANAPHRPRWLEPSLMAGTTDKFTHSAQSRLLWPGMTSFYKLQSSQALMPGASIPDAWR